MFLHSFHGNVHIYTQIFFFFQLFCRRSHKFSLTGIFLLKSLFFQFLTSRFQLLLASFPWQVYFYSNYIFFNYFFNYLLLICFIQVPLPLLGAVNHMSVTMVMNNVYTRVSIAVKFPIKGQWQLASQRPVSDFENQVVWEPMLCN